MEMATNERNSIKYEVWSDDTDGTSVKFEREPPEAVLDVLPRVGLYYDPERRSWHGGRMPEVALRDVVSDALAGRPCRHRVVYEIVRDDALGVTGVLFFGSIPLAVRKALVGLGATCGRPMPGPHGMAVQQGRTWAWTDDRYSNADGAALRDAIESAMDGAGLA